jgi:hypothetical protein
MRVLVACEFSGVVRRAFAAKGHDVISCDLLDSEDSSVNHFTGDVLTLLNRDSTFDLMIAHPPCTDLASSGARWFKEKQADGRQKRSIEFFLMLVNANIHKFVIENPVGIMSTLLRKPDQIIQPWMFGHAETKSTCLWLKGLPALTPTNIVEPDYMRKKDGSYYKDSKGKRYSRVHFMSGRMKDTQRWKERSRTYQGIANAMADQWGNL